jgi:hypothetical protein
MIPDTDDFSEHLEGCTQQKQMNLYTCKGDVASVLLFESEDSDTYDRSMQPIYLNK